MNRRQLFTRPLPSRQDGATLVVALILLGVLMLSGLAAMYTSSSQFRMAGNLQYRTAALNQAETAAAAAESWLATGTNYRSAAFDTYSTTTPYLYPAGYLAAHSMDPLTMAWTDSNSVAVDAAGEQRYLIELLGKDKRVVGSSLAVAGRSSTACTNVNVYRVSTRGTSARGAARVVQTVYSVKSC